MPNIAISSGHGLYIRGASCTPNPPHIDEVDEARKVVDKVHSLISGTSMKCVKFHDNTSRDQNTNLATIVNWHNAQTRDYDVSVHFNAYSKTTKAMGTEVWYVTQSSLAATVSSAMASAGGFINRGAKKSTGLYFLNKTNKPAILLEVCFVDSEADCNAYRAKFDAICKAIAEKIAGVTIGTTPPVEPPVTEPPPGGVESGKNVVGVVSEILGDVTVYINDSLITGHEPCEHVIKLNIKLQGDVILDINGQQFHNSVTEPPTKGPTENHKNIICTVFGGKADPNNSAYAPYDVITDTELSCALPWKWTGARPKVRVFNTANELSVLCEIRDVGPWLIDDEAYVLGDARPVAEPAGSIIPRGKNQGRTSNGAGIDLTPGSAAAIKLSGKGTVHWMFEEEGVA